jgi:hypothetical protein
MFSKDEQRIAFAKYYEDLSIPKEELFDNSYVNLCNIRQSLLEEEPYVVVYVSSFFLLLTVYAGCDFLVSQFYTS